MFVHLRNEQKASLEVEPLSYDAASQSYADDLFFSDDIFSEEKPKSDLSKAVSVERWSSCDDNSSR